MVKKFLIFILFIFNFMAFAMGSEVDLIWKKVDENSFINMKTIVASSEYYGYSFMLKSYNKGQYEPVNGQKISYTVSQYALDCGSLKYKIGVIDSFAEDGSFINGDYNRYAKFRPIVSGTAVYNIASKICRPIKSP